MDTLGLQSQQMRWRSLHMKMGAEATSRQTGHSNSFSFAAILLSMYSSSCMLRLVFLFERLGSFSAGESPILRDSISDSSRAISFSATVILFSISVSRYLFSFA